MGVISVAMLGSLRSLGARHPCPCSLAFGERVTFSCMAAGLQERHEQRSWPAGRRAAPCSQAKATPMQRSPRIRQPLPTLCCTGMCECRERRMRWSDLSTACSRRRSTSRNHTIICVTLPLHRPQLLRIVAAKKKANATSRCLMAASLPIREVLEP